MPRIPKDGYLVTNDDHRMIVTNFQYTSSKIVQIGFVENLIYLSSITVWPQNGVSRQFEYVKFYRYPPKHIIHFHTSIKLIYKKINYI